MHHDLDADGEDLKIHEVADRLRLTPRTISRYIASNEIRGAYRTSGAWRIPQAAVIAFIERCRL